MSDHAQIEHHAPAGATTKLFMMVWIALLVLTAIEVFLAYIHTPLVIMLTVLMGLSVIKAGLIIAYFMHLKYEKFSLFLILFPMLIFCILMLFVFMPDAQRALDFRPQ
jgi:cytochrome c oxidase subunit 4